MRALLSRSFVRHGVVLYSIGWLLVTVAAAQTVPSAEEASVGSAANLAAANFGVVIRLSEQLFQRSEEAVSRTTDVRECIVGVCNVGTAQITGDLETDLRPRRDGIAMDLIFRGTSVSRTVGRENSARICTLSTTRVEVTTPLTFDLKQGFRAGESTSQASIVCVCRNVEAEVPGLRGHIVRTVARQRISEQECQIRRESEEATRRRVAEDTRIAVEARLKSWNAQVEPLRQLLLAQAWYREERVLQFASDERHFLLFIEKQPVVSANESAETPGLEFPPETLPDPVPNGLVDVIFYTEEPQKEAVKVILGLVEGVIDEYAGDQPIADRLSFATKEGPNWVMLSVSADTTTDEPLP